MSTDRSLICIHVALVVLTGCGAGSYTIERTLGGVVRPGPFVPPYAYEHYVRGELALASSDFGLAASEFELARSGADDDPLLCAREAIALHHSGDARGAARVIEEGLALDPRSEAVLLAAGTIAEAGGELDTALQHYEGALAAAPRSIIAIEALVSLLDRMGDPERAAHVLSRHADASRVEIAVTLALAEGEVDRAMRLFRLSERISRTLRVRTANALLEVRRPVLAAEVLAALGPDAPRTSEERRVRIATAAALRDDETAEALLALPLTGDVEEELSDARAFLVLGRAERAEALAVSAAETAPSLEADIVLANALLADGRFSEAASLAASVPAGSSVSVEAREIVRRALEAAGLPALGAEM